MAATLVSSIPPHCPRTPCRYHRCAEGWRWERYGFYARLCTPHRIPRFRCRTCGCTFSSQTFSTTYYLKRPDLLEPIAHRTLACSGFRQIAREARGSPTTVMGIEREHGRPDPKAIEKRIADRVRIAAAGATEVTVCSAAPGRDRAGGVADRVAELGEAVLGAPRRRDAGDAGGAGASAHPPTSFAA